MAARRSLGGVDAMGYGLGESDRLKFFSSEPPWKRESRSRGIDRMSQTLINASEILLGRSQVMPDPMTDLKREWCMKRKRAVIPVDPAEVTPPSQQVTGVEQVMETMPRTIPLRRVRRAVLK